MRSESQRARPRVAYRADVRLVRPGRSNPVRARSLNLSPSGVLVETRESWAVGTDVLCEIPLPGGERQFKGQVTRTQRLAFESVGLGIKFVDLGRDDAAVLEELVRGAAEEADRSHLVKVKFEGLGQPLRSRATVTRDGIRLSTALPFLRLSSKVGVSFIAGDSRIESQGVLKHVGIEPPAADGVPRLSVDLTLPQDDQRPEPTPSPVTEATPLRARGLAELPGPAPQIAGVLDRSSSRRRTRPPEDRASASARAATTPTPEPPAHTTTEPVRRASFEAALPWAKRLVIPATLGFLVTVALLHGASLRRIEARLDARLDERMSFATAPGTPPAPTPRLITRTAPPAPVEPAPPPVVDLPLPTAPEPTAAAPRKRTPMPPPLPPDAPQPSIESDGISSTAVVRLTGSLAGMSHYSLSEPRGLLVNLPQAESVLPPGLYWTRRDGFRVVWIRKLEGGGVQLRFMFTHPAPDEQELELVEDGVKVRVRLPEARSS